MIGILSTTAIAFTIAGSVSALVIPRAPKQPDGWATHFLEPYGQYHRRYLAINCQGQHGTQFFDDCCHPLLATETLETARPAKCIPTTDETDSEPSDASDDSQDDGEVSTPDADSTPAPVSLVSNGGGNQDGGAPQDAPTDDGSKKGKGKGGNNQSSSQSTGGDQPAPTDGGDGGDGGSSNKSPTDTVGGIVGDITGGFATFYEQEGKAGACGDMHSDDDFIAALDFRRYGNVDQKSDTCGKRVHIVNNNNGKSVDVVVADACPTCENENCIDLSHAAFNSIATPEEGMVPITWSFV
jgi:hypothetical protein